MTPATARRRALRDAVITTTFVLVSQLVVVPLVGGGPAMERLGPALLCSVLVFAATYVIRRTADERRPGRG
jgi:hypothetical protein